MHVEKKILEQIKKYNGKLYRVGGCVRDYFLNIKPKDIDYLVTNIELKDLQQILSNFGKANEVGKSFGIITVIIDNESYDFAIPRTEFSTGDGHKDFEVKTNKNLSVIDDLSRRDCSCNAIAIDVDAGKIIDPYDGVLDIKNKIIRAVRDPYDRFEEDPLRILRAIQFAARFNFEIEENTFKAMQSLASTILTCPAERIHAEFDKVLSKIQSNETLIKILKDSGIGFVLFGEKFNPMNISLQSIPYEYKADVGFLSLFINGCDLKNFNPTLHQLELLKVYSGLEHSLLTFREKFY